MGFTGPIADRRSGPARCPAKSAPIGRVDIPLDRVGDAAISAYVKMEVWREHLGSELLLWTMCVLEHRPPCVQRVTGEHNIE